MKLLDTDTCIGLLRGRPEILERLAAMAAQGVATSWVTAGELYFGAARSNDPAKGAATVTAFLSTLAVLGPDLASARLFGEMKARLRAQGHLLADADLLIASVALANHAVVVTGNRRHFERVPGVVVEDWLHPSRR